MQKTHVKKGCGNAALTLKLQKKDTRRVVTSSQSIEDDPLIRVIDLLQHDLQAYLDKVNLL